jgi:hypothetical protein
MAGMLKVDDASFRTDSKGPAGTGPSARLWCAIHLALLGGLQNLPPKKMNLALRRLRKQS